jgi:DNA-binding IclR family transcriptional regulator
MISPKTGRIDTVILEILANADGTVEEIAEKTGIKEEAVYHVLELLRLANVVKKQNNRYFAEEKVRVLAQLLLDLEELDITN